jgi:hypothetical protein
MARRFKTISEVQIHLKTSITDAIQNQLTEMCIKVVQDYIRKNVYEAYTPNQESYDRTFELLNSVTVGNINVGTKYATFEIYMDTEKIGAHIRSGVHEYGGWNAHADVFDLDMSEYIPMWVEEGTSGSLWDREPAYYMYDSWVDLSGGDLARELANALRSMGWKVVSVS